ncbi:MAG: tetratricopeptide repeat protein [Epsilonproteobacteria bacterium]|nr:tetratricopeptide repeat protein [Campylobacterota bacterium]
MSDTKSDTIQNLLTMALKAHREESLKEAQAGYENVLELDPSHAQALCNLGIIYKNAQNYSKAIALFTKALESDPKSITCMHNFANLYRTIQNYDKAIGLLQNAIEMAPKNAHLFNELAITYEKQGNTPRALHYYTQAIHRDNHYIKAYNNIGVILYRQKRYSDAVKIFEMAQKVDPHYAGTYLNLGAALNRAKRYEEAKDVLEKSVTLDPNNSGPYTNLGNVFNKLHQHHEALHCHKKAITLEEDSASNYANIAITYKSLEQYKNSAKSFEKSLTLNPTSINANFDYATLLLLTGKLKKGFEAYEWREKKEEFKQTKQLEKILEKPRFTKRCETEDKRLLIFSEQGFGDNIQFVRYVKLLKKQYPKLALTLTCQPELITLFQELGEIDTIIEREGKLGRFDYQIPLLSLPYLFETSLKSIPSKTPYLNATKTDLPLNLDTKKINIGLVWGGSNTNENHHNRLLELKRFIPILNHNKINVYSLQVGEDAQDIDKLGLSTDQITDLSEQLHDFKMTASAISQLDLVISSDTSVAHLAGALKKPVWILLQKVPDWRWLLDRNSSPWYPSMKLFRQSKKDEWDAVYESLFTSIEKKYKIKLERV